MNNTLYESVSGDTLPTQYGMYITVSHAGWPGYNYFNSDGKWYDEDVESTVHVDRWLRPTTGLLLTEDKVKELDTYIRTIRNYFGENDKTPQQHHLYFLGDQALSILGKTAK